jgi:hypothetical protein
MDSTEPDLAFSAAQWRVELRKVVRKMVTPDVIQQLVQRQIELAIEGQINRVALFSHSFHVLRSFREGSGETATGLI